MSSLSSWVSLWFLSHDTLRCALNVLQAGLFSAVVTAFVIDSYKLLQQNPNDLPNKLLLDMVYSLQEISGRNTSQIATLPFYLSTQSSPTSFTPPRSAVWLNGLWFASLASSLLVAVLAMLSKQWLHAYGADLPISPHDRSRVRQYRYDGVIRWQLSTITSVRIASLPFNLN